MKIHSEVANLVVIIYILRMMTTHQRIGLPVAKYVVNVRVESVSNLMYDIINDLEYQRI